MKEKDGTFMTRFVPAIVFAGIAATACGDRGDAFSAPLGNVQTFGLETQVALLDDGAHRVTLLSPHDGLELDRSSSSIGKNVLSASTSADGKRLFVLSRGDTTRRKDTDELPSLTVIDGATATTEATARRYPLESLHSGMAIDPEGRWVALFSSSASSSSYGSASGSFVENPNEIVLVDLTAPVETAVTTRTIRSFGGLPQRLTFTTPLLLPGGPRRLLVIETTQDLALLDLDHLRDSPARPEITVRLTSGSTAAANAPAGVVFDDGEPQKNDDARIGVRLANGSSVVTLTLVANGASTVTDDPSMVPNDFRPLVNLTDVGGIPGQIVFVRTDLGRRLAAIVPSTRQAVLVDPDTSITTNVDLPDTYAQISLVTDDVGDTSGKDTALLYGSSAAGVALWSLGRAEGQPYRSVEVVPLSSQITDVIDVPKPRAQLKILQSRGGSAFYVMDLATRTASPLLTQGSASLQIARDGERLWAYQSGTTSLAQISLANLHPIPVTLDRRTDAVFDVAARSGGRALVAIDAQGAVSAAVLDAVAPDGARSKSYYGLLLEDL